jgi:cytochrome c553
MSSGKIVGIILSAIIGFLLIFLLLQEGGSTPQEPEQKKVEEVKKAPVAFEKSQEEEKLEELQQQATTSNNSVSNLYSLRCKACHGSEGQGSKVGPSIKGKEMAYILGKLDDYKNNRITNSLMQGLLNNATQEELNALAQEISSFK